MITFGDLVDPQQMTGQHIAALLVVNCIFCAWGQKAQYVYQTPRHITIRLDVNDNIQFEHMGAELKECLPKKFEVKLKKPFIIIEFERGAS